MTGKILMYLALFVWECIFKADGKAKKTAGDRGGGGGDENEEAKRKSAVVAFFKNVIHVISSSKRNVAIVVLLLVGSLVTNWHLINKVSAVVREEVEVKPPRKEVSPPTNNSDADEVYYQRLVDHLHATYGDR